MSITSTKNGVSPPVVVPFWQILKFNKIDWNYCNFQTFAPHCVKILKQQKYLFLNQSVTFVIYFFKPKPSHYLSEMSEEYHKHFQLCWLLFKLMLDQEPVKYQYSYRSLHWHHCHVSIQYWENLQCCNTALLHIYIFIYLCALFLADLTCSRRFALNI